MRNKKPSNYTLSPEIIQKIKELADMVHGKKSNIVEWAVNELYKKIKKEIV